MKIYINNCFNVCFIVVTLLCSTGVSQNNHQLHPAQITKDVKNDNSKESAAVVLTHTPESVNTHASINIMTTVHSSNENKQTTLLQLPPLKFPQKNTTNAQIHFKENKTIEGYLLHGNPRTNSPPPLVLPNENSTKYHFIKPNETIIRQLLHESTGTVKSTSQQMSPTLMVYHATTETVIYPPKVFPNDTKKFKIITNKTKEDLLLYGSTVHLSDTTTAPPAKIQTSTSHPEDIEVPDLLSKKQYHGEFDVDQIDPKYITTTHSAGVVKSAAVNHLSHNHMSNGRTQVSKGPLAGILIGILLLVTIVGYGALVIWRRTLELKYGNRERLVNEEDFDPHYDNRFEL